MIKTTLTRASVWRTGALAACLTLGFVGCGTQENEASGAENDAGESNSKDVSWCEVKTLLQKRCNECHDGAGSAGTPMGLTSYAELTAEAAISKGKKVFQAVAARIHDDTRPMPPKGALESAELALLDDWIAAGAPEGDATRCAEQSSGLALEPVETWPPPGGCDATYMILAHGETAEAPYMVAPGTETHPQVSVDAPWQDEVVQAIAFRPVTDNKKVLHHWILYSSEGSFLTGWAPGDDARTPLPPDVGMEMPTGLRSMRLDMHYNSYSASEMEGDRSGVEVCVVKGPNLRKNRAAVTMGLTALRFPLAPANTQNYAATGVCNVVGSTPVHLMTASPHSHTFAVHHKFSVKKKNGQEIVMLDRPFQFGEQKSYDLSPEVVVEEGDTITTTCIYTNNTNQPITFGENTGNEMCFNFAAYWPKGGLICGAGGLLGGLLGP